MRAETVDIDDRTSAAVLVMVKTVEVQQHSCLVLRSTVHFGYYELRTAAAQARLN